MHLTKWKPYYLYLFPASFIETLIFILEWSYIFYNYKVSQCEVLGVGNLYWELSVISHGALHEGEGGNL